MARPFIYMLTLAVIGTLFSGCSDGPEQDEAFEVEALPVPTAAPNEQGTTIKELREALGIGDEGLIDTAGGKIRRAYLSDTDVIDVSPLAGRPITLLDISDTGVSDLSPLEGMPLEELYAERTRITDLSPLAGLPLKALYLNDTPVSDLTPVAGMSFQQLNLVDTQVADLEWCRSTPSIGIFWLRSTPVTDLSPLEDVTMTSLDVQDTAVADLSPLSNMQDLRRLNIAGTAVTDLWPLADLQLTRLVFTPSKIERGIEVVRNMPSLTQLGTQFEVESDAIPAAEFWKRYDAGEFAAPSEAPVDSNSDNAPPSE